MVARQPGSINGGPVNAGTTALTNHGASAPTGTEPSALVDSLIGKKALIEAVCAVTTDSMTISIARWATMNPGGHAWKHLDHYLEGSGQTLTVDLEQILAEDEGVRFKVHSEILIAMNDGKLEGVVAIPQSVYKNHDWQYALGGININWRSGPPIAPGKARIGFRNDYRWHPSEARISQCVHQAAERLKISGAKDYYMEGRAFIIPSVAEWEKKLPSR